MDYIDLYQIHRWDFSTPIEETLEALDTLVRDGKVRYLGASSMAAWQFSKALYAAKEHSWHHFVSMQNHYNLIYREEEREMNPLCIDQGVALIPWSPLARGYFCRQPYKGGGRRPDEAGANRPMTRRMYFNDSDEEVACRRAKSRARAWSITDSDRLRQGASGTRRSCPNHRRNQDASSQGNFCDRRYQTQARKKWPPSKSPIGRIRFWAISSPTPSG